MDIAALSTSMAMSENLTQVGTRVLDMSLETLQTEGDGMVKMLEQSVNPHIGGNIDVSV